MAYLIFIKDKDNVYSTIYRIAENQSDLNNLNINLIDYKIIEDNQNFNAVKYGTKYPAKYNGDVITYIDVVTDFRDTLDVKGVVVRTAKQNLQNYIENFKNSINNFKQNNPNHPLLDRWNNYLTQLNNLNLDNIQFPLEKSLEQYFTDISLTSLCPLQLP